MRADCHSCALSKTVSVDMVDMLIGWAYIPFTYRSVCYILYQCTAVADPRYLPSTLMVHGRPRSDRPVRLCLYVYVSEKLLHEPDDL